jgi:hypothetical protein
MTVRIGTVNLQNILTWEEEETDYIPKKRIVSKKTPTTQSEFFSIDPRTITLKARLTKAEKLALRNLKNQFAWQPLYDYDDAFIDYVWIERIYSPWRGDEDATYPWLVTITLICSTT